MKTGQSVSQRLSPGHPHNTLLVFLMYSFIRASPNALALHSCTLDWQVLDHQKHQPHGRDALGTIHQERLEKTRLNMSTSGHVNAVRTLYRRVLNLHRRLPLQQKALGNQYARDEFRRHKNVSKEQATEFLQEWKVCCTNIFKLCTKDRLRASLYFLLYLSLLFELPYEEDAIYLVL